MKNLLYVLFIIPFFSFGQFKYSSEFPVHFKIDNVTLGVAEDVSQRLRRNPGWKMGHKNDLDIH